MAATQLEGPTSWEEIAATKRASLEASFPKEWIIPDNLLPPESQDDVTHWPERSGWFTSDELSITQLTASELIPRLASGQLKSVDVVQAFCKRAVAAHKLTNCLSETCFDRAIVTAQARDEHFARTRKPIGPLHGLPISLKDDFNLQGLDSTLGLTSFAGKPAESDSTLVELLEASGAVFYVKTNVPTAMMIGESVNNIFGRTVNPKNRKTTSGGSSGGEAALLLMKGSPLGVGSDIGGSLRIPAACTGIFALQPSTGRFPVRNTHLAIAGQEAVLMVNGPMATTFADVELYCKSVVETRPWLYDPKCLPIPWRSVELPRKLKIAVMRHDGIVLPTPPVTRALKEVAAKLETAGCEILEWDPVDQAQGFGLWVRMVMADGGVTVENELKRTGEPWRPEMKGFELANELSVSKMWELQVERSNYQNSYLDRWNKSGIDAILCPTMPFPTAENGKLNHVGYTAVYNVLDYSSVSFPTGLYVEKDIDKPDPAYIPLGPTCKAINEDFDPDLMNGLPISLQLVARKLEEEKVTAMARFVLEAMK